MRLFFLSVFLSFFSHPPRAQRIISALFFSFSVFLSFIFFRRCRIGGMTASPQTFSSAPVSSNGVAPSLSLFSSARKSLDRENPKTSSLFIHIRKRNLLKVSVLNNSQINGPNAQRYKQSDLDLNESSTAAARLLLVSYNV